MSYLERRKKRIDETEKAIAAYREAGVDIHYQPAPDNDRWFVQLMEKHGIPPVAVLRSQAGRVSVLMVND